MASPKPSLLVSVPHLSGMADRIIGFSTGFLIAYLTDRAFQIGRRSVLPQLEHIFVSPSINWTRPLDEDWLIEPLQWKAKQRNYNYTILSSKLYYAVNTIDDFKLQDRLLRGNLVDIMGGDQIQTTMLVMNRGKTIHLFENPHHKKRLENMGLTPETAFGCIVDYLIQPKPHIFLPFLSHLQLLVPSPAPPLLAMTSSQQTASAAITSASSSSSSRILKIGIQIRCGDKFMSNKDLVIKAEDYQAYFSCAQQIEDRLFKTNNSTRFSKAIWYLVTDMPSLRKTAVEKYGAEKIITNLETTIEHSSKETSVCAKGGTALCGQVSDTGLEHAAAEWWLLSMMDYYVITRYSGFGRSAAMHAALPPIKSSASILSSGSGGGSSPANNEPPQQRRRNIYTVNNGKERQSTINCDANSFTDLETLSYDWSGI